MPVDNVNVMQATEEIHLFCAVFVGQSLVNHHQWEINVARVIHKLMNRTSSITP